MQVEQVLSVHLGEEFTTSGLLYTHLGLLIFNVPKKQAHCNRLREKNKLQANKNREIPRLTML